MNHYSKKYNRKYIRGVVLLSKCGDGFVVGDPVGFLL